MTASPDASVVIPVFNGAGTIAEQLAALSRQTFGGQLEVLVCDNGSTDRTRAVVAEWMPRIVGLALVDASARRGPAHARNAGIARAAGRVVLFCDADDVVDDDWVTRHVESARPGVVGCGREEFALLNPGRPEGIGGGPILRDGYLFGLDTANVAMMRDDLVALGGFDESCRYVEDVDLAWRAQQSGLVVAEVPALVHSRLRPTAGGVVRQRYNWGRYQILLRVRNRHLAPMPLSLRYTVRVLLTTIATAPVWWWRLGERRRRLGLLGGAAGELDGHLRYRLLRRVPARILLNSATG